jgi:aerobic carbon-monoxide dehydrogenase medium subunit
LTRNRSVRFDLHLPGFDKEIFSEHSLKIQQSVAHLHMKGVEYAMAEFDYVAPSSLEATLQLFTTTNRSAMLLAGGTHLLPALRANNIQPVTLIDLRHLDTLKFMRLENQQLAIGARTTLAELERSQLVQRELPLLTEMSRSFATPLVRSSATLGGNIVMGASTADAVVPLLALNATLALQTSGGRIWHQSLASFLATRPVQAPLVTQISVSVPAKDAFWFYYKLGHRRSGAVSVASVALVITLQGQRIRDASIALGAITPVPLRATQAETVLLNAELPLSERVMEHCLSMLVMDVQGPLDDLWASSTYRVRMGQALVRKALKLLNLRV